MTDFEIYTELKKIAQPIHEYSDQMIAFSKWIKENFIHKSEFVTDIYDLDKIEIRANYPQIDVFIHANKKLFTESDHDDQFEVRIFAVTIFDDKIFSENCFEPCIYKKHFKEFENKVKEVLRRNVNGYIMSLPENKQKINNQL